jgi:SOS-response transcriptional repressor LexA
MPEINEDVSPKSSREEKVSTGKKVRRKIEEMVKILQEHENYERIQGRTINISITLK